MALLDPQRRCIVLRVIYDGPAFAGKTTNLRRLAKSLGSEAYTAGETENRTLFFDWVDYQGGLFEGMPIRTQIVGVPGQEVFENRRRLLIETADVVAFVADSRPAQMPENVRSFDQLQRLMSSITPACGIVVQANKRDVEGAVSLDDLRDRLGGDAMLAMTEATAIRNEGVRETFVLAVRLALDRARALWDRRALPTVRPEIDDGPELLSALQAAERGELSSLSQPGSGGPDRRLPTEVLREPERGDEGADEHVNGPPFPEASVPPGLVWPPVEGRVVMHEAARASARLERSPNGDWVGSSRDWVLRAPLEGLFFEDYPARSALIEWARWHVAAGPRLSAPRSIVLVPEAADVWRLWQIVRRVPTLRDIASGLFDQDDDEELGEGLFRVIDLRLRARDELVVDGWPGRLDLDSIGVSDDHRPLFTGFSPFPSPPARLEGGREVDDGSLIRQEIGPLLRGALRVAPGRLPAVLASLRKAATNHGRVEIADTVQEVLLGS